MIWLQVGQILSTAMIGSIVAWIAWRQWKTAHEKVKLDLFDRRFAVFMDVREIVSQGGMRERFSDHSLPNEVIARGRFLFGPDILIQLEDLHKICTRIETKDDLAFGLLDPWFRSFIDSLKPYMNMGDLKS